MKTSNKLLILAGVILAGLLISYNLALKAEYETGRYKMPFKDYTVLPYKNFDKVSVKGANELKVEIRQSDTFSVQVFGQLKEDIEIKQTGKDLVVQTKDADRRNYLGYQRGVVIGMPELSEVSASEFIRVVGKDGNSPRTERAYHEDNQILISGFDLDALKLHLLSNSVISLQNNTIRNLDALVDGTSYDSQLQIDRSGKIVNANITVTKKNSLKLTDPDIGHLKHSLSDSATLILTGRGLKLMGD